MGERSASPAHFKVDDPGRSEPGSFADPLHLLLLCACRWVAIYIIRLIEPALNYHNTVYHMGTSETDLLAVNIFEILVVAQLALFFSLISGLTCMPYLLISNFQRWHPPRLIN
jgi:hypothetical protein